MFTLRPYDRFRKVEDLGAMWTLPKDRWMVICTLSTHPLGWELAVTLNGELVQTQVCKVEAGIFDTAERWRAAWESKGWT